MSAQAIEDTHAEFIGMVRGEDARPTNAEIFARRAVNALLVRELRDWPLHLAGVDPMRLEVPDVLGLSQDETEAMRVRIREQLYMHLRGLRHEASHSATRLNDPQPSSEA